MRAIDRLYKKEDTIVRSVHIDNDLYLKVKDLSESVFDASVSKIINVCIENTLLKNSQIIYYKKPKNVESTYRSIMLRKSFYDKLIEIKDSTGISFSRLINGCIKDFLFDYNNEIIKK